MRPNGVFRSIVASCFVFFVFHGQHVNAFQTLPTRCAGWPKNDGIRYKNNYQKTIINFFSKNCQRSSSNGRNQLQMRGWDGDDVRWTSRLRRKFFRRRLRLDTSIPSRAKNGLVFVQILLYGYQILTTILMVRRKFPSYWPEHAIEMVVDSIWGSAVVNGPLTNTFGFSAAFAKSEVPYRYITSGFFHSGLLHLLVDLGTMSKQPSWLATGLGGPLYATTFFGSIIAGNIAHVLNTSDRLFDVSIFLGSSAGICGLFGLMFVCLTRIASVNPTNGGGSSGQLVRGMAIMIGLGLWMDNVNVAMNIGGFFGGIMIGILCGPRYGKDYSMRRKNSAGYDPVDRDYRSVMGFGIMPSDKGIVSLKVLYSMLLAAMVSIPKYRKVPIAISRGLWKAAI